MRTRAAFLFVAAILATFNFAIQTTARADMFGSGTNTFSINFVNVGNAGNAADTTGYGAVAYSYRISTYEIPQDVITKATASGMANVISGPWTSNQPAANINWYEAAAFANWLNTSTGKQAAYDLSWDGSAWSMNLWSSGQAWQVGGENFYRNKDAYYFLPSENEWYKAAYSDPAGPDYFLYPTASSSAPVAVDSGTAAGTAVYNNATNAPAGVDDAGGLSSYGTMGQGGNVWEWNETALDGANSSSSEVRTIRGGGWISPAGQLSTSFRSSNGLPDGERNFIGFRVASVPEPSTYALLLMTGAGALLWARRRR